MRPHRSESGGIINIATASGTNRFEGGSDGVRPASFLETRRTTREARAAPSTQAQADLSGWRTSRQETPSGAFGSYRHVDAKTGVSQTGGRSLAALHAPGAAVRGLATTPTRPISHF